MAPALHPVPRGRPPAPAAVVPTVVPTVFPTVPPDVARDTRVPGMVSTRQRLVTEAMRLFGAQGYAGTSVAQIEAAAGLSPGSGSLYRHFPSKAALLAEGIGQQARAGDALRAFLADPAALEGRTLRERLEAVVTAGLRRLEQERDFNRILLRDLEQFPELLEQARTQGLVEVQQAVAAWLGSQADDAAGPVDLEALAAMLVGATANYWLLGDVYGGSHPSGVAEKRYVAAIADLVAARLGG